MVEESDYPMIEDSMPYDYMDGVNGGADYEVVNEPPMDDYPPEEPPAEEYPEIPSEPPAEEYPEVP